MEPPAQQLFLSGISYTPGIILILSLLFILLLLIFFAEHVLSGFDSIDPVKWKKKKAARKIEFLLLEATQLKYTLQLAKLTVIIILSLFIVPALSFPDENVPVRRIILLVLLISLIYGLSKTITRYFPAWVLSWVQVPAHFIYRALSPVTIPFVKTFGIKEVLHDQQTTESELEQALELNYAENEPSPEEHKLLQGIVKFGNTEVRQIMTPRIDVISINITSTFDEVISIIKQSGYSRMPVFDNEKVMGLLYIKDLLQYLDDPVTEWRTLIRAAYFVPENKKIVDLLEEFQQRKRHLAIVVDEYGAYQGIISLEDIIEEIVGDISDEFDEEEITYSRLDNSNYIFEGKTPLRDFYKILAIDGEEFEEASGESGTIAGFLLEQAGRIPKKNEKIDFGKYTFTVEAADRRKVKRVKVTINP